MDGNHTAEHILVVRAQSGDEAAFSEILHRYRRPVLGFIYRMTGDLDAANDLAQEVFVRLWRGIGRFRQRPGAAFSTWVFQVARNAALDWLRYRKRHPTVSLVMLDGQGESIAGAGRTAHEEIASKETGAQIAAAVALLPEDQRTALVLSEYEGLSYAEIAAVMECSPKSVEARLYRARQFLRARLAGLLQ